MNNRPLHTEETKTRISAGLKARNADPEYQAQKAKTRQSAREREELTHKRVATVANDVDNVLAVVTQSQAEQYDTNRLLSSLASDVSSLTVAVQLLRRDLARALDGDLGESPQGGDLDQ